MVYNTGNGASFRNYQINHKFQEKCWKLKKKKVKLKYFSETTRADQPEPSVQSEKAGLEQSRERKCL